MDQFLFNNYSTMTATFNGQAYGSGMADFFMGSVANFGMGTYSDQNKEVQILPGVYGGDTWKLNRRSH